MRELTVIPLSRDKIAQAYPLVRHSDPSLTLEQWQAFAEATVCGNEPTEKGIVTVISEQGYFLGLFAYRVDIDLRHSRVLTVDNFHAMDLLDPGLVAATLAERLDELAKAHGCGAIHTTLAPAAGRSDHWLSTLMEAVGHEVECVRFCKTLAPA